MRKKGQSFLRVLILAILINEGSLHGYLLYKKILHHTCKKWKPSIGTIYRTLNEMVREGLISKHRGDRRHNYSITPKGIDYFIKTSKTPITRMTGVLTTVLEAYSKIIVEKPSISSILTRDLREKLKKLSEMLEKHSL